MRFVPRLETLEDRNSPSDFVPPAGAVIVQASPTYYVAEFPGTDHGAAAVLASWSNDGVNWNTPARVRYGDGAVPLTDTIHTDIPAPVTPTIQKVSDDYWLALWVVNNQRWGAWSPDQGHSWNGPALATGNSAGPVLST